MKLKLIQLGKKSAFQTIQVKWNLIISPLSDYLTLQDQLNFLICKALCHLDGDWNVLC